MAPPLHTNITQPLNKKNQATSRQRNICNLSKKLATFQQKNHLTSPQKNCKPKKKTQIQIVTKLNKKIVTKLITQIVTTQKLKLQKKT